MTVSTSANRADYNGNGTTTSFAVPFLFPDPTNLLVLSTVIATGISTALVLNSDYTVAGAGVATGGTVSTTVAPATGIKLSILLSLQPIQQTHWVENDPMHAATLEAAVDYLTLLAKQEAEQISRAISVPVGESGSAVVLPPAASRVGMLLGFDGNGALALIAAAAQSATALALGLLSSAGATMMSYLAPFTGALLRTQASKNADTLSILEFTGVDPTGTTDSTVGLQAAITAARVQGGDSRILLWRKGTYKVTNSFSVGSNITNVFEPGVVIDASGLPNETTPLFKVANQVGVYFDGSGALLKGARATANPTIEGGSAAFYLYGSGDVTIRNFRIQDFATDGIIVTGDNSGSGPCTNVVIENCTANNNRRNAMSIISAKGCTVIGGEYNGSNGAPNGPFAGIDVEPNANCFIQAVVLINVRTSGNLGPGIQLTPMSLGAAGAASNTFDVTIYGGRSFNDGTVNTTNKCGLLFTAGGVATNQVFGQVVVNGFVVDSPMDRGVAFNNWDADKAPRAILNDCVVYDPDSTLNGSGNDNRTAYVVSADAGQAITNLGNITMRNCRAEDRRASPRMPRGFELGTTTGKTLKNVLIIDPISVNYAASVKSDVYSDATAVAGGMLNVDVVYTTPRFSPLNSTQNIGSFMGQRINATASLNGTLPLAANCPGAHYEIQTDIGVASVTILPQTGDTIIWLVDVASAGLVLDAGAYVSLRSRGGTSWVVEEVNGKVRPAGAATPGQIFWTTAVPSTGTHNLGDVAINKAPAVGSPKGWRCTVTGSPGTWVSEGNL